MLFWNQILDVTGCMLMLCCRKKCNLPFNLAISLEYFQLVHLFFKDFMRKRFEMDRFCNRKKQSYSSKWPIILVIFFFKSCVSLVIFCDVFRIWHATYVHTPSNENICMHFSRFSLLTIAHKLPGEYFQVVRHNEFIHIPSWALSLIKNA